MIIDCISDLHGCKPALQGGDLLIIAGDLTTSDKDYQYRSFYEWLDDQDYNKKIVIAGNHDEYCYECYKNKCIPFGMSKVEYLCDSGSEFKGLKIWGSPWTPTFLDWHFMKDHGEPIRQMWDLIPDDIDILITHGPPFGILDQVNLSSKANNGKSAGCEELRNTLDRLKNLKLHVFGHIHEGYGQITVNGVIHVNASIMNEDYYPVNKPIRIVL